MSNKLLNMKSIAKQLNDRTYTDYYNRLNLLARSVFEWKNLPPHINEAWIEKFLFYEGKCLFFKDEKRGLMVAKCNQSGKLNSYDEPTLLKPYGVGYVGKSLKNGKECVLIKNNDDLLPTLYTIQLYALRLAECTRTSEINIHAQKTPLLLLSDEKQRLTLKNVYAQWNGFEPVIFGDKNLDLGTTKVLKTDAPIVFDKLRHEKHEIWNECMTFLGINNANMDKRERLVTDEVQANNEQIGQSSNIFLKARIKACEQINELFKTNISVDFRKPRMSDSGTMESEKEGVVNEC